VRAAVIHKSPPDYCVGKSLLHGKILHEVKVHLYGQCVVAIISVHAPYLSGKILSEVRGHT
jgi:hypothetical protein